MDSADVLIVGGGPAGSAAAILLGQAGRKPLLIERSPGPRDPVCGGFLGWDAIAALVRLGVDPARLGARRIDRLRLASRDRIVEAKLPRPAAGLSRRVLDSALLQAAEAAGAGLRLGRAVRSLDAQSLSVRFDDGSEMQADALLLATGKHELRGASRERVTKEEPAGIRTALAASPALAEALAGTIELHLFEGGYGGLLLQEDGSANLCLSVSRQRMRDEGGIDGVIAGLARELPLLRERLAQGAAGEWSAIAGVPYGWRARVTQAGLFRLGDQAAVIASLAGDGIAIALASGRAAAETLIDGRSASAYQAGFARRAARPVAIAERLRWAAEHRRPRAPMMRLLAAAPFLPGLAARLTRIG